MRGECTCGWYWAICMKNYFLSHALSSSCHMVMKEIFHNPLLHPKYTDLSTHQSHKSKSKSSIQLQIKIQPKEKPFSKSFEIEYFSKKATQKEIRPIFARLDPISSNWILLLLSRKLWFRIMCSISLMFDYLTYCHSHDITFCA